MKYYSPTDIAAIALPHVEMEALLVEAFKAARQEQVSMPPRTSVGIPGGARFVSFPSAVFSADTRVAASKWIGIADPQAGPHHLDAVLLLSDPETGRLRAILDAQWITLWRTATVTLIAARRAARAESSKVAFIACGRQAEAHLELLHAAFPLKGVQAYSRTMEASERFARRARGIGLAASACPSMEECVMGADIVISSLPGRPADSRGCRAQWFAPHGFVALVDLGRSFDGDPGAGFANVVVDDLSQYEALRTGGLVASIDGPLTGIGELLDRPISGSPGRKLFVPTGCGYLDAVLGMKLVERAEARGLGIPLPT